MLVLHQTALGLAALAASAAAFTHPSSNGARAGLHRRAKKFDGSNNRAKYVKDAYILQVDGSASGLRKRGTDLASVSC